MSTNVSKREWTWVGVAAALLLAFTTLPYLVGYKSQTPEMAFSGAVFNRGDYAVHMATMQSGARGEWLYRMRFTSESVTYIWTCSLATLVDSCIAVAREANVFCLISSPTKTSDAITPMNPTVSLISLPDMPAPCSGGSGSH